MKEKMKMTDRFNRDEMFYRLDHLNVGIEKKEEVLKDLKKFQIQIFKIPKGHRISIWRVSAFCRGDFYFARFRCRRKY